MKRLLLTSLFLSSLLMSETTTTTELQNQIRNNTNTQQIIKNSEKYKTTNIKSSFKVDKRIINDLNKRKKDILTNGINENLKNSVDKYPEDAKSPMTKKEYTILANKVYKANKVIKDNSIQNYVLYFTSKTVPEKGYQDFLLSVGILQQNGVNIQTKQYLRGIPKDAKNYLQGKMKSLGNLTEEEQKYIRPNVALKFDPRIYNYLKIEKVPVIVFATCTLGAPSPKRCKFRYMSRGDQSLSYFFESIDDKYNVPEFKKYHQILISNKFNNKEQ